MAEESLVIWHVNMQGLSTVAKGINELAARIRLANQTPDVICLTETHLGKATEELSLEGYSVVSRRDRDADAERGGVLVFALESIKERTVELEVAKAAERIWVVLHTNHGPYLLGIWYRPGCGDGRGEVTSILSLKEEVTRLRQEAVGTIVCGDMNVHQKKWLKFSSGGNTTEGETLQTTCE